MKMTKKFLTRSALGLAAAVVMGFVLKYDIADLVGTQVSVVAKMPKSALAQIKP